MKTSFRLAAVTAVALGLAACSNDDTPEDPDNVRPSYIRGTIASANIVRQRSDGVSASSTR